MLALWSLISLLALWSLICSPAMQSPHSPTDLCASQIPPHSSPAKRSACKKGTRWNLQEDSLLKQGIQQFGYGSWKQIASLFPPCSRSILQIKNRAQHIRDYKSAQDPELNAIVAAFWAQKKSTTTTEKQSESVKRGEMNSELQTLPSRPRRTKSLYSSTLASSESSTSTSSCKAEERNRRQRMKFRLEEDEKEDFSSDFSNTEPDQFLLIPPRNSFACHEFSKALSASIKASAFALADMHAHLMHNEVIGLLGGQFCEAQGKICIEAVFPCKSCASSGTECEMDPLSELEARTWFQDRGMKILGWYHSHPIFVPNPSVRDVQTQWEYQAMVKPFVGLIISPYDQGVSDRSTFKMFWVPGTWSDCLQYREPVNVPLEIIEKGYCMSKEERERFSLLWTSCLEQGKKEPRSTVKMLDDEKGEVSVGKSMLSSSLACHCGYELEELIGGAV